MRTGGTGFCCGGTDEGIENAGGCGCDAVLGLSKVWFEIDVKGLKKGVSLAAGLSNDGRLSKTVLFDFEVEGLKKGITLTSAAGGSELGFGDRKSFWGSQVGLGSDGL